MNSKNMKVDELRSELVSRFLVNEQEVAKMTKAQLIELYDQKNMDNDIGSLFGQMSDEDDAPSQTQTTLAQAMPKFATPEWQEFVIGLLLPEETVNGAPKSSGLRRVSQLVLGPIVEEGPVNVIISPDDNGRAATVVYEVKYEWAQDVPTTLPEYAMLNYIMPTRTFRGVADCVSDSTVYGKHPAATAETKAASRAYKKALSINITTAEEKISGEDDEMEKPSLTKTANPALIKMIEARAKTLGVNLAQVVTEYGSGALEKMSQDTASKFFTFLNEYSNKRLI